VATGANPGLGRGHAPAHDVLDLPAEEPVRDEERRERQEELNREDAEGAGEPPSGGSGNPAESGPDVTTGQGRTTDLLTISRTENGTGQVFRHFGGPALQVMLEYPERALRADSPPSNRRRPLENPFVVGSA